MSSSLFALRICCRHTASFASEYQVFGSSLQNYVLHLLRYEPEVFAGLIYRMAQSPIVIMIFVNGKVVITGEFNNVNLIVLLFVILNVV